jgi:hypothetical protein
MIGDLLDLARKKGSDKKYLLWLRTQPSAIDGHMDYDPDTGQRWCDPCHYRTAANSGVGCKPEYSAIPLTHAQHLEQHRVGQFNFRPREWWEYQTEKHLRRWIES